VLTVNARIYMGLLSGKTVRPGVHFLAHAVDPILLMAELRGAGVEYRETIKACE
jgi:hypothetical protein